MNAHGSRCGLLSCPSTNFNMNHINSITECLSIASWSSTGSLCFILVLVSQKIIQIKVYNYINPKIEKWIRTRHDTSPFPTGCSGIPKFCTIQHIITLIAVLYWCLVVSVGRTFSLQIWRSRECVFLFISSWPLCWKTLWECLLDMWPVKNGYNFCFGDSAMKELSLIRYRKWSVSGSLTKKKMLVLVSSGERRWAVR